LILQGQGGGVQLAAAVLWALATALSIGESRGPRSNGFVDFSVVEGVKHFDCGENPRFLRDFIESGDTVTSKFGKINKPAGSLVAAGAR